MRSAARFPDPMQATRRANTRERMERQRDGMTAEEAEAGARKVISERFDRDGQEAVIDYPADFQRANLPLDKVTEPMVRRLIKSVQLDMAVKRA